MEDEHFISDFNNNGENVLIMGVTDGHGGSNASKFVAKNFLSELSKNISKKTIDSSSLELTFNSVLANIY